MNGHKPAVETLENEIVSENVEEIVSENVEVKSDSGLSWLIPTEAQSKARLFAKLAKVMSGMSRIPKNGVNTHFSYKFVKAEDVADKVRESLSAEGVAFFAEIDGFEIRTTEYTNNKGERKVANKTFVRFVFTFADGETGATFACRWIGEAIDEQDKDLSKAATSALKYFLLKTFIIPTGDDPDADGDKTRKANQARTSNQARTTTPPGSQAKTSTPPSTPPPPPPPGDPSKMTEKEKSGFAPKNEKDFTTFWTVSVPALGVEHAAAARAAAASGNNAIEAFRILSDSVPAGNDPA